MVPRRSRANSTGARLPPASALAGPEPERGAPDAGPAASGAVAPPASTDGALAGVAAGTPPAEPPPPAPPAAEGEPTLIPVTSEGTAAPRVIAVKVLPRW